MQFPKPSEYNEYYGRYIDLIDSADIVSVLKESNKEALAFYRSIPEEKWNKGYAPGKWTLKEALIHLIDSEQIFAYRALRIARGDQTPLPGFEQDEYVPNSGANNRTVDSILEEYEAMRKSTYLMFKNFEPAMWNRTGTASGYPISVRALAFIIAGHEKHHMSITRERYLQV